MPIDGVMVVRVSYGVFPERAAAAALPPSNRGGDEKLEAAG